MFFFFFIILAPPCVIIGRHPCVLRGGGAVLPLRTQVVSMKHATSVITDDNNVIFGIKDILKLKMMPVVLD